MGGGQVSGLVGNPAACYSLWLAAFCINPYRRQIKSKETSKIETILRLKAGWIGWRGGSWFNKGQIHHRCFKESCYCARKQQRTALWDIGDGETAGSDHLHLFQCFFKPIYISLDCELTRNPGCTFTRLCRFTDNICFPLMKNPAFNLIQPLQMSFLCPVTCTTIKRSS